MGWVGPVLEETEGVRLFAGEFAIIKLDFAEFEVVLAFY